MENLPFTLAADYPKPHLLAGLFIIGSLSFSFSRPYQLHTLQIHHKSEPTFVGSQFGARENGLGDLSD
ncbi:hypothetical protein QQP08_006983, partial [Theobroma cacao]